MSSIIFYIRAFISCILHFLHYRLEWSLPFQHSGLLTISTCTLICYNSPYTFCHLSCTNVLSSLLGSFPSPHCWSAHWEKPPWAAEPRESNSGLPHSKPTHYNCVTVTGHPNWFPFFTVQTAILFPGGQVPDVSGMASLLALLVLEPNPEKIQAILQV